MLQRHRSAAGCSAGAAQWGVRWTAEAAGDVGSLPRPGERALLRLPQQGGREAGVPVGFFFFPFSARARWGKKSVFKKKKCKVCDVNFKVMP